MTVIAPADYWRPRTLWFRHDWDNIPGAVAQASSWAEANGLNPNDMSGVDPIIVGRGRHDRPPSLQDPPTLTVILMPLDPNAYEPQPGDELLTVAGTEPMRIRRTVPLKVPPPPDLFVDVAAEVQRAAADPVLREWLRGTLDVTDDLAEALGHDRHSHPDRTHLLAEVRRLRRVNREWEQVMAPLIDGLAERGIKAPLGHTYVDAALAEIDRLREEVTGGD